MVGIVNNNKYSPLIYRKMMNMLKCTRAGLSAGTGLTRQAVNGRKMVCQMPKLPTITNIRPFADMSRDLAAYSEGRPRKDDTKFMIDGSFPFDMNGVWALP
jgi:hypothetical protein